MCIKFHNLFFWVNFSMAQGWSIVRENMLAKGYWFYSLIIRYMRRGWMIRRLGHLNDVLQILLRLKDHVHIRSAMFISTEPDQMVGSRRQWRFMAIIQGLLHFTTIPSFQVTLGMDLIIAIALFLRIDGLARHHSYLLFFVLYSTHSYNHGLSKYPLYLYP